jgi:hypothetical protein
MKKSMVAILALLLVSAVVFSDQKQNTPSSKPNITTGPKPFFPAITVLTPNGGETWGKGSTGIITWSTSNVHQNVNIILKAVNVGAGGEFTIRAGLPPTAAKVVYQIPSNIGYEGKVFKVIITTVDGKVKDESDNTFTIRPIKVTSTLTSNPSTYTGACPVTIDFSGTINVDFPCEVVFFFFNHDDGTQSQNFTTPNNGTLTAHYSRQVTGSQSGHTTLYIVAPLNQPSSNTAYFTVNCAQQVK